LQVYDLVGDDFYSSKIWTSMKYGWKWGEWFKLTATGYGLKIVCGGFWVEYSSLIPNSRLD
jgi:hypothetical protein